MTSTLLAEFFTIVLGFSAVGFIFDQITQSRREMGMSGVRGSTFSEVVQIYYDIFFARFFSERIFSLRFVVRSSLYGLITLGGIVLIFNARFGVDFDRFTQSFYFLAVSLVGFLVCFWITLVQTQLFVSSFLSAGRKFQRGIFLFSDVIVSSNLFVFVYSFFISVGVLFFSSFFLSPLLVENDNRYVWTIAGSRVDQATSFQGFPRGFYEYQVSGSLERDGAVRGETSTLLIHSSEPISDFSFLINHFKWRFNTSVSLDGISVEVNGVDESYSQVDEVFLAEKLEGSDDFLAEVNLVLNIESPGYSLRSIYTSTFVTVDAVEDLFLVLPLGAAFSFQLSSITFFGNGFVPFSREPLCFHNGSLSSAAFPLASSEDLSCVDGARIVSGTIFSPSYSFLDRISSYSEVLFPLSPVYIGAMLPSLTFYTFVIVAFLLTSLRHFLSNSNLFLLLYKTVPFSLAFLILGIFCWFVIIV